MQLLPTCQVFMKAQKMLLDIHTYSIFKMHSCLQLCTYNTAVYCRLWYPPIVILFCRAIANSLHN